MFNQVKALMKANQMKKELKSTEIEAKSANGWVVVIFSGEMHIKEVSIAEEALKPENKNELEKTIQQTIAEALSRVQVIAADKAKEAMKDLNINIPGL